ncbi:MAG: hypothetical protein FJW39_31440 [Acidobacteria bacterium]|nr:hypothetical protein [Acidobacteriota bacterium]
MRLILLSALVASAWAQNFGGTLRMCLRSDPRTLDPHLVADEPSETVRYLTAGMLVRLNRKTQKFEPAVAESWKISEGGRTITFELRKGLKFSDGTPLSGEDVVYSILRLLDPKLNAPSADAFRVPGGGQAKAEAVGNRVTVRFPAPLAGLPGVFDQVAVLSSKSPLKEKAVLGPFAVKEYKAGQHLLLSRNPHYWRRDSSGRTLPYLDSIRLDIQPNREIELMRFRRGEVHLINRVEPDLFDRMMKETAGTFQDGGATLESELMWFNLSPG